MVPATLTMTQPAKTEHLLDAARQHHQAGRLPEAESLYQQVLDAQPDHAEALQLLGMLHYQAGRFDAAAEMLCRAANANPASAECRFNLALALLALGRWDDAIAALRDALSIRPSYPQAYNSLGTALQAKGQLTEAVEAYRQAVALNPDTAGFWSNLGIALHGQGNSQEAVAALRQALKLKPDYAEAYNNLGRALVGVGRIGEALAACQQALQFRPEFPEAMNNLANALRDTGRINHAISTYRKAISLAPDDASVRGNLIYAMHFIPGDPAAVFQEHLNWNRIHAQPLAGQILQHRNDAAPDRRLKIGYVSPDFRQHSVGFFLLNLLANHDPAAVEVFCYSDAARPDAATARFQQAAHHWKPVVGVADAQLAQIIIQDQIDILVDLAGHTAGNRLLVFARKPAPIQVSYCGYPDTTGLATMDYRFTDAYADPPGTTEQFHSEQLVRLPRCFLCYAPPADGPEVGPVPAAAGGRITFGSFNSISKLSDATVAMWSAVLSAVPNSRLMIKSQGLAGAPARQQVLERFAARGIAADRLELHGRIASLAGHLELYHQIDIALDTYPYHGTTTSCEAMWMGVPVVTLAGKTHASRVGVSLLSNVGLEQLIAQTPEQYVQIAADLAKDLAALSVLRSALRSRLAASPLLDGSGLAREVEAAYRVMWKQWCESAKKA
jgi:predicted O-linked N-acetylglucosamine transferase (SPINDLY family)